MKGDNLKEQERTKLHNTIWRIANELRGSVDGWDFKAYVLGFLFYRFISENLVNYLNAEECKTGVADFNYAELSDDQAEFGREDTVNDKGFYILPSELFENVRKRAKNDDNLNETLSKIFRNIEQSAKGFDSEDDFRGLFDDLDVNGNKLGPTVARRNERLVKLMNAIGKLELGKFEDNTIDAFGDAYEYLMTMYAGNAGKSGGEFFTPQEVSELLAKITVVGKTSVNKVYDPAAGSGSLLLKFAKVLGKDNVRQGFYGQEINITTYNLCRINMFLHDINYEKFNIAHGDTLKDPKHWDDEPEAALHASMVAMNEMKWQKGATKAIILLTDAGYHEPDKVDGSTVATVAKRSLEIDPVNVYPVVEHHLASSYTDVAKQTSGQVVVSGGENDTIGALTKALTKIKNRPNAKLKIGEYYAEIGQEITFDASDSYVVDGKITKYEWDFDGDGKVDQTTTTPTTSHVYNEKFDGIMQVRMSADNDTVSNISAPVKVGIKPNRPVGPGAPRVSAKIIERDGDKATIRLNWQPVDNLSSRWLIRLDDNNLGWAVSEQRQLDITDVDISKTRTITVTGVKTDGYVGKPTSIQINNETPTPQSENPIVKQCPYKIKARSIYYRLSLSKSKVRQMVILLDNLVYRQELSEV
jgi:type I restriction-modification system, M subunit